MNAKTSCFNKKIYTKNLIQGLPFILLMSALLILVLISAISSEQSFYVYENYSHSKCNQILQYTLYTYSCDGSMKAVMACYSFLCGIFVFRYLYNKKLCGTIHAFPLTRTGLFLSNTLSGLTMLVTPFILTAVVLSGYMLILGYGISHIPLWLVVMTGYCLIFFALAVLTAMVTAHMIAAPIIYGFFNFGFIISQVLIQSLISVFYFGLDSEINHNFFILTPFAYLVEKLHAVNNSTTAPSFTTAGIKGIILYSIIAVFITGLSLLLYRKRQLETQGDPVVFRKLQTVLLYISTTLCAVVMTIILFEVFHRTNSYYITNTALAIMIVLFLVCSIIAYFVLTMLLKKTTHVFHEKHRGIIVYTGVMLFAILAVRLDIFHIEGNVPDAKDIASIELYFNGYNSVFENKENIETITQLHKAIIDKKALILTESDSVTENSSTYSTGISIDYTLKNGKTLNRYYYIIGETPLQGEIKDLLDDCNNFINDESLMLNDLNKARDNFTELMITFNKDSVKTLANGTATTVPAHESLYASQDDAKKIIAALEKDIQAGTLTYESYYSDDKEDAIYYYVYIDAGIYENEQYTDYSRSYQITSACTNTIEALQDWKPAESEEYEEY